MNQKIFDETSPTELLDFPADAKEAFSVLLEAMYTYCSLRNMYFGEMTEKPGLNHGQSLVGAVHLLLADRPYNIYQVREDEHSIYDSLTADDMKDFVWLCGKIFKTSAHGHIFCSGLQFWQRYQHLATKKVHGGEMDERMADDAKVESTIAANSFSVEPIQLLYGRAPGIYKKPPSARKPHHSSVVQQAIHFCRSGAYWEAVLDQLNYKGYCDIPTTHL